MGKAAKARIILDYDGTLTREADQAGLLRERSLDLLAGDLLKLPRARLEREYAEARRRLLEQPEKHGWTVNGLLAAYCDEGAFLLNTATMQELLAAPAYQPLLAARFGGGPYDPVMACVNWMFHELTFDLPACFRSDAGATLRELLGLPGLETVVLTNSKGDKVRRNLTALGIPLLPAEAGENPGGMVRILGDVRQYDMAPEWRPEESPQRRGERRGQTCEVSETSQVFSVLWADDLHPIDLRRPAYYEALLRERAGVGYLGVVADGLSLAGSLPLALGIPFFLITAPYSPAWVVDCVERYACGVVLDELNDLLGHVRRRLEVL